MHREWSPDEHPEWLVFEAEQQLQIRPRQYWVARYLMQHPGAIVQLNMVRTRPFGGEAGQGAAAMGAAGVALG